MPDIKIIVVKSHKGGVGKSTVSEILADSLPGKTVILNFDYYQQGRVETSHIPMLGISELDELSKNGLIADNELPFELLAEDGFEYMVIDSGGYETDNRLIKHMNDVNLFIYPTKSGDKDITALADTINYDKEHVNNLKSVIVLNDYYDKEEREKGLEKIETVKKAMKLDMPVFILMHSKTIKRMDEEDKPLSLLISEYEKRKENGEVKGNLKPYSKIEKYFKDMTDSILQEMK